MLFSGLASSADWGALFVAAGAGVMASALAFAAPALIGAAVMTALPRRGPLTAAEKADEVDFIAAH